MCGVVWCWLGRYKEPNGDWSIQFVEIVIAWFLMCQEILWKINDTFLMRDRWSDGQSFDTFHIPHKLHWCQIQNMHACIRHAPTFFKSFVYKVHASLCVPQSLRNSAIAFKHTQWCRKVSDRRIWLTKFHSDWQKIDISASYFIVRTDKIFKISPNDWHVQKVFNISAYMY